MDVPALMAHAVGIAKSRHEEIPRLARNEIPRDPEPRVDPLQEQVAEIALGRRPAHHPVAAAKP